MELWDVYDEHRNLTGRTCARGDALAEGDYHLVVDVWIKNAEGKYLISKRTPNKSFGGLWENTSGAVLAGEDSLTGALREAKEELGVELDPLHGARIRMWQFLDAFLDVWLFRAEVDIDDVVLQEGETCCAKWATIDEMYAMLDAGTFVPFKRGGVDLVRDVGGDWEGEALGTVGHL